MVSSNEVKLVLDGLGVAEADENLLMKCKALCDKYEIQLNSFQESLDAFLVSDTDMSLNLDNIGRPKTPSPFNDIKIVNEPRHLVMRLD